MAFSLFSKKSQDRGDNRMAPPPMRTPAGVVRQAPECPPPSLEATDPFADDPLDLDFTLGLRSGAGLPAVEVAEVGDTLHPRVEDVVMRFANGDMAGTLAALEEACRCDEPGLPQEALWMMRFELYLQQDNRAAFEERSLDFAMRFGRSPPIWPADDEARVGGIPVDTSAFALSGALDIGIQGQLQPLLKAAHDTELLRVDVAGLESVDNAGCALLMRTIQRLRQLGRQVVVTAPEQLLRLVEQGLEAGKNAQRERWLLWLELLQQHGDEQRFEQVAVDYAVTFELSPPSWEPPPACSSLPLSVPASGATELAGELIGNSAAECIGAMQGRPDEGSTVNIDFSRVRRLDFVAASLLFNHLVKMSSEGTPLRLTQVSYLLAPLLQTVGIPQVATIELRRL